MTRSSLASPWILIALVAALSLSLPNPTQATVQLNLLGTADECDCPGDPYPWGYNDIWGFTQGGTEFAVLGAYVGIYIYDLTDPSNPVQASFIPGVHSNWRDMKTMGDHLYSITEHGGGLQIIDISDPYNAFEVSSSEEMFMNAHNLYVDAASQRGFIFDALVPESTTDNTLILDLSNPTSPVLLGSWTDHYVHDGYVLPNGNTMYAAKIYEDDEPSGLFLVDITNPAAPTTITNITWPNAFCHNVWVTPDAQFAFTTDENTGGHVRGWDISNTDAIVPADEYSAHDEAIVHNVFLQNGNMYISYYTEGVRVVNIDNPNAVAEVGFYDTTPDGEVGGFSGNWGVYAFPSGLVIASDVETGLYVFEDPFGTTAVGETALVPINMSALAGVHPNPFNPATTVTMTIGDGDASSVLLQVFDVNGRIVNTLHSGPMSAGTKTVSWDGRADTGRTMASGTYYIRLQTPQTTEARQVVMLK